MPASLFQFAVIYNPKPTKDAQGNDTTPAAALLVEPTWKLAKSSQEVAMLAARAVSDAYLKQLDEIEVVVRPF